MRVRLLCSVALCVALVFALCRPAQGHNGVLAVAPELTNITIDGDFSDWPEGLAHYPITNAAYGEPPTGAADFDASFQIGYSEAGQEVYVAVTVRDDPPSSIRPTVGTRRTDVKYTPTSTIGKCPRVHSAKPTLRFNSRSMAIRA